MNQIMLNMLDAAIQSRNVLVENQCDNNNSLNP